ncbi:DUF948 domain-containing protein [Prochlorothrix hollandica]|uniref:DUF948 domain-containing protein n=1 Tax=Prochlorothrix hollandica TaxID=1223 RepID=UPI001CED034B|nr:DUF948 domain-containing protein [Prochlorothrix hollandica]
MTEPLFWLAFSLFLVAISLTAVLVAAVPALQELARAARSAEKLFDTLARELPPTLDAIRLTGLEISELTEDVTEGVKNAGNVARQVDDSMAEVRRQARQAQRTRRSITAGVKAAWKTFTRPSPPPKPTVLGQKVPESLRPTPRPLLNLGDRTPPPTSSYPASPSDENWITPPPPSQPPRSIQEP